MVTVGELLEKLKEFNKSLPVYSRNIQGKLDMSWPTKTTLVEETWEEYDPNPFIEEPLIISQLREHYDPKETDGRQFEAIVL